MNKFVVVSILLMAWAFYELSGGSDFEPTYRRSAETAQPQNSPVSPEPARITPTPIETVVTASAATVLPTVQRTTTTDAEVMTAAAIPAVQSPLQTVSVASVSSFQTPQAAVPTLSRVIASPDTTTIPQTTLSSLGTAPEFELTEPATDMRIVSGSRVNMRGGPGTSFGVLGVLLRGQEVEVLRDDGTGWVKLRDQETGRVGWMAGRMLAAATE